MAALPSPSARIAHAAHHQEPGAEHVAVQGRRDAAALHLDANQLGHVPAIRRDESFEAMTSPPEAMTPA